MQTGVQIPAYTSCVTKLGVLRLSFQREGEGGFRIPTNSSRTPAGCLRIQYNSDIIDLEIGAFSTG